MKASIEHSAHDRNGSIAAVSSKRLDKPHLVCLETRAGHGSGKPTSKIIEEATDVYAFLGHFTGLEGW